MSYLTLAHEKRKLYTRRAVADLKASGLDFKSLACTGLSGLLIAPIVAERLHKKLVIIRKGESTHGNMIEYDARGGVVGNYVIIDDFTETGDTIKAIQEALARTCYTTAKCVGVYLYRQSGSWNYDAVKKAFPDLWFGFNPA